MEMGGGSMSTTAAASPSGSSGMTMGGSSSSSSSSTGSGMDMGGMGGMGGMGMQMTFIVAHDTPLFSASLTPTGAGGYAGLCIFLIVLAAITRGLLAFRTLMQQRQLDRDRRRRYVVVRDAPTEAQSIMDSDDAKDGTLISARGAEERVRVLTATARPCTAWRLSTDLPRALLTTLVAGMGYLLMLAVMTYNVGYFLSVLGGIFLGDLAVGRFTAGGGDH